MLESGVVKLQSEGMSTELHEKCMKNIIDEMKGRHIARK